MSGKADDTGREQGLVRRDPEEIWSEGNVDVVDEIYAEDFVLHDPSSPDGTRGREGYREYAATYRDAFPDAEYAVEELVAERDAVAMRYTARGTHEGELMGIEPTGEEVTVTGMELYHVDDGKITEMWTYYDALGVLRQLGVVPSADELVEQGGDRPTPPSGPRASRRGDAFTGRRSAVARGRRT
ncbi:ester cyclase [halophilic archaeon]|nr:ester cyclase [halophilic archaeon]